MKQLSILILAALFSAAVFTSCGSNDSKTASATKDKYEKEKETLEEMEKKNPLRFLSAVVKKDRKNIWGQTVVKGEVTNNAKVATYKDINFKILYYSKTAALIGESVETVYDKISPGASSSFKSKEYAPKGTDSVVLKVISAKVE